MTTKPGIAVIGLGHWGRNLVRNVHALEALSALYDTSPATRAAFAATYPRIHVAAELQDIWSDTSIAGVMIATPAATHGALVGQALGAGKHVFVEKPLCLDVTEASRHAAKAAECGRVLMVGHLLRYHPAFRALASLVQEGVLGTLRYIYSNRLSLGRIRREENALWSFAPHDISMILAITGEMPELISTSGGHYLTSGVADTTLSHLTFPSGVQAHLFVSWLHPYKDQRLVVIGDRGMVVFDDVAVGTEKLRLYRHKAGWNGELPVVSKAEAESIPYNDAEPLRVECEAFLAAVRGDAAPPSDADEGIRVLRVLDACQRALVSGERVRLTP